MGTAIALRDGFLAADMRRLAKASKDAGQTRRLLALAVIYDGCRRTEAGLAGGDIKVESLGLDDILISLVKEK